MVSCWVLVVPVLRDDSLGDLFPVAGSCLVVASCWSRTCLASLSRDVPSLLHELPILSLSEPPLLCPFVRLAGVEVVGSEGFFTTFIPVVLPEDAKAGPCETFTWAAWISGWGDPAIVVRDGVESLVWVSPTWSVVQSFPGVLNPAWPLCKCNRSSKKIVSFILLVCKHYKVSHIYFSSKKSCGFCLLLSCCSHSEPTQRMPWQALFLWKGNRFWCFRTDGGSPVSCFCGFLCSL